MTALHSTFETLATSKPRPLWLVLAPICVMVFMEFLAMGIPLSVLPVHVHGALGFGTFVVGVAIGVQSWVTLATRHSAGTRSDRDGPRRAVLIGLILSTIAGGLYALSSLVVQPTASLAVLVLGRGLLGMGESLVITGALAWGISLAGRERSGVVMAWVGIAMYAAMAIGAPLGTELAGSHGFVAMGIAAAMAPVFGIGAALLARPVAPLGGDRLPFYRLAKLIWLPGAGLAASALGFGAIAAFSSLLFGEHGWAHAALAMTAFGAAFVLARLLFGTFPDRFGGARVAVVSAAVAALGQLGLWLATSPEMAVAASALTGFGFSLVFPAFGVEAIRRVPPHNRGVALGAYTASFDLAMGVGVPLLGVAVAAFGYRAAFGIAAVAGIGSLVIAGLLYARSSTRAR